MSHGGPSNSGGPPETEDPAGREGESINTGKVAAMGQKTSDEWITTTDSVELVYAYDNYGASINALADEDRKLRRRMAKEITVRRRIRYELVRRTHEIECPKCAAAPETPCLDLRYRDGRTKQWPHDERFTAYVEALDVHDAVVSSLWEPQ